jgi:hypothetical protein
MTEKSTGENLQTPCIHLTARFPRWTKGKIDRNNISAVSFIFHDPAGEWFSTFNDAEQINFLHKTRSLLLLVDPCSLPKFNSESMGGESSGDAFIAMDPIENVVKQLREQADLGRDEKIAKDVAVILTKSDCGIFDDTPLYNMDIQSPPFNEKLVDEISQICEQKIEDLGGEFVVSELKNSFQHVRFFPVSALGAPPSEGGVQITPGGISPDRVEEPFLWVLHRWGLV